MTAEQLAAATARIAELERASRESEAARVALREILERVKPTVKEARRAIAAVEADDFSMHSINSFGESILALGSIVNAIEVELSDDPGRALLNEHARQIQALQEDRARHEGEVARMREALRQATSLMDRLTDAYPGSGHESQIWTEAHAWLREFRVARASRRGIYTASRTRHAAKWRDLRAAGWPVISSWIDEAGPGESASLSDLWRRCTEEPASAAALILYHENGDVLKGALVEVGSALICGVPVFVVGDPPGSWVNHPLVTRCTSIDDALARIDALAPAPSLGTAPSRTCDRCLTGTPIWVVRESDGVALCQKCAAPSPGTDGSVRWSHEQVVEGCRNIGYDLTCGACAELFFTGVRLHPHDDGCQTFKGKEAGAVEFGTDGEGKL